MPLTKILWIILILFIDSSVLHLGCKAATVIKENWTKEIENGSQEVYFENPRNSLHHLENNSSEQLSTPLRSSTSESTSVVAYLLYTVLVIIIMILVKCCRECTQDTSEEISSPQTHPPPNRCSPSTHSTHLGRPLAPPMTSSRSLIVLSNENFEVEFVGRENPCFIPSASAPIYEEPQNYNPTSDMPPAYDDVVRISNKS